MKRLLICCLLIGASFPVAAAQPRHQTHVTTSGGPVLWHGVRAGMSEEQVRRVLPGLAKNDRNNDFHAPKTEVAGESFNVGVEMIEGKVTRVSLTSEHGLPTELERALEAKYGTASKPYSCEAGTFYHCEAEWRAPGGVAVSLIYLQLPGATSTEIRYEAPDTSGL